jgi:hypothetical protein
MNDYFAPSPEKNLTFGKNILRKWQGVTVSV